MITFFVSKQKKVIQGLRDEIPFGKMFRILLFSNIKQIFNVQ
ncbi:hypothetical protein DFO77_12058 [Marinilabilia salmonicolor]|jgi:hypothetical protein|uniref:Uncharacterized protein n=1 Tax=Marinilabilia salmonicolor TaxID=989 RepID=A0A2T0XNZ2_9BACT|nr:hypothetical protein BY457_105162 [Marinilabilia salmonicolor]RCW30840.1 hypothetical protein DFO77_12058 [Marinilabilia salmonicolor]